MAKSSKKKNSESVLEFGGSTTSVEIPDNSRLELLNNFTLEAWVKPKQFTHIQRIFSKSSAYGFGLNGNQIRFTTYGIKDYDTTQAKLSVDTWVHLAVCVDSLNQAHFYVNGIMVQAVAGTQAANKSSASCIIGSSQVSGNREDFVGQIAEVRIWNVSRLEQIQANQSRRLQGNEPGLVGYWRLNEGAGDLAQDLSDNANHGTIHPNPTWVPSTLSLVDATPSPDENESAPSSPSVPTPKSGSPQLQSRQMVLVLDEKHQGISAGSGALRPQGNFTIEAWVYPATNAGLQVIYAEGETLFYKEGGELKFQTPTKSEAIASVNAGITSGSWYHVAVTRAGSRPGDTKLYINGVHNDNQKAISPVLSFGNTYLGGQPNVPDSRFQGKLLEVRVWRYARSLAEIEANRLYPMTGRELGLVRYWSLNQTFGSTLHDKTTNRAVGTLSGDAVWEEVEIPLKLKLDPQERLTRSTGLEDYGYWFKEMAKQQKTQVDPPFLRGRIWA